MRPAVARAISVATTVRANAVVPQKMAVSHAAAEEISNVEDVSIICRGTYRAVLMVTIWK